MQEHQEEYSNKKSLIKVKAIKRQNKQNSKIKNKKQMGTRTKQEPGENNDGKTQSRWMA